MDALDFGLQRLGAAETLAQLIDGVWDLRDSAFDSPGVWTELTPLALFQALAEELERAPQHDDVQVSTQFLGRVFARALDPRTREN